MDDTRNTKFSGKKVSRGRVGRPRANPRPVEQPPEEEILAVAGRLFAQKGFAGTSTREIAEGAGLRQPSLFHYYPKKERILEALLGRIGSELLHITAALESVPAGPPAKLYRLVHGNVKSLSEARDPVAAIVFLPEVQPPHFPDFWSAYDEQLRLARRLIERGVQSGELVCDNVEVATHSLAGMASSVPTWLSRASDVAPEQVARAVADLQLRALLRDPARLDEVRDVALALPLRGPTARA